MEQHQNVIYTMFPNLFESKYISMHVCVCMYLYICVHIYNSQFLLLADVCLRTLAGYQKDKQIFICGTHELSSTHNCNRNSRD